MSSTTSCVVLLFLLLATLASQSGAHNTRKCMQKTTRADIEAGEEGTYDFIFYYNITSAQSGQTCSEFLQYLQYYDNENGTIIYKINGTTYVDHYRYRFEDGIGYLSHVNNPEHKMHYFVEFPGHLVVVFICTGNTDHTWVGYAKGPNDYTKEADAKARELTDNPEKYRLDPNGCL